jgi:DNA-binding transcriptional ArsR family regulator
MPPDRLDAVFFALADGTRRAVVQELLARETITATQLAGDLPITRQAVAKHLAALSDAGLVVRRREGRETRYELTPEPLGRRPSGSRPWAPNGTTAWAGSAVTSRAPPRNEILVRA